MNIQDDPSARVPLPAGPLEAAFDHEWRWRQTRYGPLHPALEGRAGQRCRVIARGADGKVVVEFEDGLAVVALRWAIRRKPASSAW